MTSNELHRKRNAIFSPLLTQLEKLIQLRRELSREDSIRSTDRDRWVKVPTL